MVVRNLNQQPDKMSINVLGQGALIGNSKHKSVVSLSAPKARETGGASFVFTTRSFTKVVGMQTIEKCLVS